MARVAGKGAAIKYTPEELEDKINAYFEHCEASKDYRELKNGDVRIRQELPTVTGLAVWLNVHKSTLYEYLNGEYPTAWIDELAAQGKGKQINEIEKKRLINAYSNVLARARDRVEQITITAAANGDIDNKIASLLMSNWGYTQKVDTTDNSKVTVAWQDVASSDAQKYAK